MTDVKTGDVIFPLLFLSLPVGIGKLKESRCKTVSSARFRFNKIVWLFVQANC